MRTFLMGLAMLSFICAGAQASFQPGYFVKNDGTKIDCFIRNVDKEINPTQFEYKLTQEAEPKIASIDAVSAFEILNTVHKYQRQTVKIERSGGTQNGLKRAEEIVFNDERLFLRVLVEGSATLYVYNDNGGIRKFFYRVGDGKIEPLIYYTYLYNNAQIGENSGFRQQLWSTLKCKSISQKDVLQLRYTETELSKFFRQYNQCKEPALSTNNSSKTKGTNHFAAFVGLNTAAVRIEQTLFITAPSGGGAGGLATNVDKSGAKLSPLVGFSFIHVLPFNNRTWAIVVEPYFQDYKNEIRDIDATTGETKPLKIRYTHVAVPVGVRHSFSTNKSSFYGKAAAAWDLVLNPSSVFEENTYRTKNGLEYQSFNVVPALNLGVGYIYNNKVSLDASYQFNKTIVSKKNWDARFAGSVNAILGVRLR